MLVLYMRCRGVPAALTAMIVATAGVWALDMSDVRILLASLGIGVAVAATGLGGADVQLDRTGAIPWPLWRGAHLILIAAVVFGLTAAVDLWPVSVVLRDAFGLAGLAGLAAAILGSELAWTLPACWLILCAAWPSGSEIMMWPAQGPDSTKALLTAIVVGVAGLVTYAVAGPKRTS